MNTKAWACTALLAGILACSSGSQTGSPLSNSGSQTSGGGETSGSGPVSGSGSTSTGAGSGAASTGGSIGSTGSTSGAGGSGSAASGSSATSGSTVSGSDAEDAGTPGLLYDSSVPNSDLDTPVTLTMSPFTVQPNSEVYMCQWFANPFGKDVDLVKLVSHMDEGSHHFFVFNMSPATDQTTAAPIKACPLAGSEFYPFALLSQQPDWTVTFPQSNMGYPVLATNGIMLNAHFLNTGASAVTPTVTVTMYPAKAGVVTVKVGSIMLNNVFIDVPAMTTNPVAEAQTITPIKDEDYTIISHWSHMHKYATDFKTSVAGTVVYDTKGTLEPPLVSIGSPLDTYHSLPLAVKSGSAITWTCLYTNPTSSAMTFGDSANTDDMCIYIGQYYPADGTPGTTAGYPDIVFGANGVKEP
jgi:hypothetical protein